MKTKILSITEAFSMQPKYLKVTREDQFRFSRVEAKDYNTELKNIEYEQLNIVMSGPEYYYVGYNFNGGRLFQFIANTVNVEFYTIEP